MPPTPSWLNAEVKSPPWTAKQDKPPVVIPAINASQRLDIRKLYHKDVDFLSSQNLNNFFCMLSIWQMKKFI